MRKLFTFITLLALVLIPTQVHADENWRPTPSWPFVFREFQNAVIYTINGQKTRVAANIHVDRNVLWYESKGKRLAANPDVISKVAFGDIIFYNINKKLCRVIREDTIQGRVSRLYILEEIDRDKYNEIKAFHSQTMSILDNPFIRDVAATVAETEGVTDIDIQPLPMYNKFFMLYNNETFEATEHNILQHLSKEERPAYRAYTRSAEVITSNRSSMENVWITFFVGKNK